MEKLAGFLAVLAFFALPVSLNTKGMASHGVGGGYVPSRGPAPARTTPSTGTPNLCR